MLKSTVFVLCVITASSISAQMKLLDEPKSQTGVDVLKDAKDFFDKAETFIGFDELEMKARVNDEYKKLGVSFTSSNDDDSVVVVPYRFPGGKSGKFCIASAKPQFQGKVTIAFEDVDVTSVGFHLSHVNPKGTLVDAFDEDGERLGRLEISESKNGLTFCGLESKTPIAKLVVIPVKEVDADFAIDDFAFNKRGK